MGAARNRQEMRARSDGSSTCCLPGPGRDRGCLSAGRRPDGSSGPCYCDQACARTLDCCHDYARTCPAIPCVVSQWSAWSGCAEPCRTACRVRTRYIIPEPRNGGEACPALEERAGCVQYWTQQGTECQQSLIPALITMGGFGKARKKRAAADGSERAGASLVAGTAWSSGWCPWHSRPCMSGLGEGLRVCVENQLLHWQAVGNHRCKGTWRRIRRLDTCSSPSVRSFLFI
ncbi:somatomedin-B and thrombospondin type-1 domain-containing protein-like [Molothrus aeneus]|uniref:somatomedin-B and thrombospondin type-1 domain-containing protein-like n=1 Tax=Molothrus aeneus TaxID=84833 RepID=UPI00345758E3